MPQVLAALRTAHANGEAKVGIDVDDDSIGDKSGEGVVDLMSTKESALRLAVDAAVTVLRVSATLVVGCCCCCCFSICNIKYLV